ncbi:MAG: radical protein [Bacteroidetes bacterium]|nr:radical protein [Bacteroidota bacterium]
MDNKNFIKYIQAKSILSKLTHTDSWFGISYNMNLYRGCQHGCIYCDTRSECYGINDISQISIKENAIELLQKELSSKRKQKATIGTGSMNDPYMPIEKEIRLTRKALELINKYKYPVHIITKSNLVERDIDLLEEISKTYSAVSFTITTFDDKLSNIIEPFAPSTSLRFNAIETLAKKGIYTGITLMPILPFINDNIENIKSIIHKAKDSGASYILPAFGLTLRKGSKDYFYTELDRSYIGLRAKYESCFQEKYICSSPNYLKLQEVFENETQKLNIKSQMEFYKPKEENQLKMF